MTRDLVLGLSVLSIALLACGGTKKPANSEEGEGGNKAILLYEKEMGEKAYDMPAYFALLSRKHGCKVNYKAERTISDCNEGMIGLGRNGTIVRVACDGAMTKDQCKGLFDAIVAEGN
jgi:hypothetical protein